MSKILVRDLVKSFQEGSPVLNGVSISVEEGESFVILGGSGTGKSVFIKCILGLLTPDSGEIIIDGQDLSKLSDSEKRRVRKKFGMLFQGGALFDSLSIIDNVAFGLVHGQGMNVKDARKIASEKLESVDLDPKIIADVYPAELSGGMQKRVALARAIATHPEIIFFDEPTTGLDPIVGGIINKLIRRCVQDLGATAITITHDMVSLRKIGDRAALLHKGVFVWGGLVSEIDHSENPYIQQFMHGRTEGPFTDHVRT